MRLLKSEYQVRASNAPGRTPLCERWSQFSASEKKSCTGEASIGGDKSYVELLTCLQMYTGQFKPKD
jgi:hypothetical protein